MLLKPYRTVFVDDVWSGMPTAFCLVTRAGRQYAAYYNADRQMMMACRRLDSDQWSYHKLDDFVGWDGHNYVTFAFDSEGYMHLSGNMHCVPLRYYRSTEPGDISTLAPVASMTGDRESHVTYPRFITGPRGEMLFSYRDGGSGNGNEIVNIYDPAARTWRRFIDKPLFDGGGLMNAYYTGPVRDRAGVYHFAWVWRDTPDCATNHDLSYARSASYPDGFTKSDGTPIELPLTIHNAEIIDPIEVGCGLLNTISLSFDSHDRPLVVYHKFDDNGMTQVYIARREESGWRIYRTTEWDDRWEFSGNGSILAMIRLEPPVVWPSGKLCQVYLNRYQFGCRLVRFLDEATLQPVGGLIRLFPEDFDTPAVRHTRDWQVNTSPLNIAAIGAGERDWVLRWESAGNNRDCPRPEAPPSRLEVVEPGLA